MGWDKAKQKRWVKRYKCVIHTFYRNIIKNTYTHTETHTIWYDKILCFREVNIIKILWHMLLNFIDRCTKTSCRILNTFVWLCVCVNFLVFFLVLAYKKYFVLYCEYMYNYNDKLYLENINMMIIVIDTQFVSTFQFPFQAL